MILVSWRPLGQSPLFVFSQKGLNHCTILAGWVGWGVMGVQYPDWDGRAPRKDPVNRFMRVLNRKWNGAVTKLIKYAVNSWFSFCHFLTASHRVGRVLSFFPLCGLWYFVLLEFATKNVLA
jgi:hypothetical protein